MDSAFRVLWRARVVTAPPPISSFALYGPKREPKKFRGGCSGGFVVKINTFGDDLTRRGITRCVGGGGELAAVVYVCEMRAQKFRIKNRRAQPSIRLCVLFSLFVTACVRALK